MSSCNGFSRSHGLHAWESPRARSVLLLFGGFKHSGIGRENGIEAIREYLEQKAVWINTSGQVASPFAAH
jgi:hypothetical protein